MMLKIETRTDLQILINQKLSESLTLDYKTSGALGKQYYERDELIKDVTAFANSCGGQLIYGVIQNGGIPLEIDIGIDKTRISLEWLEQVIETNVSPRIQGVRIKEIQLSESNANMVAYVITVPQATTLAPHQNMRDRKYYRRFERQSVAMYDCEIRDALRRAESLGNNKKIRIG
jgi:predicted HTH transcriptional regulator